MKNDLYVGLVWIFGCFLEEPFFIYMFLHGMGAISKVTETLVRIWFKRTSSALKLPFFGPIKHTVSYESRSYRNALSPSVFAYDLEI